MSKALVRPKITYRNVHPVLRHFRKFGFMKTLRMMRGNELRLEQSSWDESLYWAVGERGSRQVRDGAKSNWNGTVEKIRWL